MTDLERKDWWIKRTMLCLIVLASFTVLAMDTNALEDPGSEKENSGEVQGSQGPGPTDQDGAGSMFGSFDLEGDLVEGRFVSLGLIDGTVSDLTYVSDGSILIESIEIEGDLVDSDDIDISGALFNCSGESFDLMVHNSPTAIVNLINRGEQNLLVTLVFPEIFRITEEEEGFIKIESDEHICRLKVDGTFSLADKTIVATLSSGDALRYCRDAYGTTSEFSETVMKGVLEGKIDGEIIVRKASGESAQMESQHFPFEGMVEMNLKNSGEEKRIEITVRSSEPSGKVVSVRFEKTLFEDKGKEDLEITMDGEKVLPEEGPEQVLEADGQLPVASVLDEGDDGYLALVYVPSFSTHEIGISAPEAEEEAGFSFVPLAIIAVILIGPLTLLTKKRYRRTAP